MPEALIGFVEALELLFVPKHQLAEEDGRGIAAELRKSSAMQIHKKY
jgi:hypothetical protein